MTRVVGVDPSLTGTGLAELKFPDSGPAWGLIRTFPSKPAKTLAARHRRLSDLAHEISDAILQAPNHPDLVVIESPAYSRNMGSMHDRSGLWWLVVSIVIDAVPVLEVAPTVRAKYATGMGNAGKDAVLLAVERRWPEAGVKDNDEADAVTLAALGADMLGLLGSYGPPAKNREALKSLHLPEGIQR